MEGWLSHQQESDATNLERKDDSVQLLKEWTVDHVQSPTKLVMAANRFTVSKSGAMGTSCYEKASLAVMYPDTNEVLIILAEDDVYRSATFVKVSGKEYLAAAFNQDGCLYLWDIKSKTSKKVFDPKLPREQRCKYMNIFKINESTIGYGEVMSSSDGSRRVFILKTDTEEWTLSATLRLFTPHEVWDMCYLKVADGTPCLLLCIPHDYRIMAVEMVGCKTRWEAGKEQMGEKFFPWGICTNDDNTVYVADFGQNRIQFLQATDGTLLKYFDPGSCGVYNIFTVRFHDQHLYVEHKICYYKYVISKFKHIEGY